LIDLELASILALEENYLLSDWPYETDVMLRECLSNNPEFHSRFYRFHIYLSFRRLRPRRQIKQLAAFITTTSAQLAPPVVSLPSLPDADRRCRIAPSHHDHEHDSERDPAPARPAAETMAASSPPASAR
jgi:hypothetical protein